LADIAGAEPEQEHSRPVAYQQPIQGFELEHMMRCAELACIHQEICRMPMANNS
jgi:hypothetical protein